MKLELLSASNFLVHLIRLGRRNVGESQLQKFRESLIEVLKRRYRDHWFPEKPFKGSGYRCIRINGKMDPIIGQAGEKCGLSSTFLHTTFPSELTMWIDPLEVSYRIGENGSICVLYENEGKDEVKEPWMPPNNLNKRSASNNHNTKNTSTSVTSQGQKNKDIVTQAVNDNTPSCKESLRNIDYILDPRKCKSDSIENLVAFVSS